MKTVYHLCTLFFLLLLNFTVSAQQVIQGQKTIGGNDYDVYTRICLTYDGGILTYGTSDSDISGEKTSANRGEYYGDYWLVRLAKNGTILWDKTIGGDGMDQPGYAEETSDSGFIICGVSSSGISGEKTIASNGDLDFWVLKLDKTGNIQWQKVLGGTGPDWASCIHQLPDGGYVVGGNSGSGISGNKTEANRGYYDYWLIKLDASGNIIWDKTYGGNSFESQISFERTTDAGFIIGGWSQSDASFEKSENNRGSGGDYWIIKTDANGNIQWDKTYGGAKADGLNIIHQTTDGGFIAAGNSSSGKSFDKSDIHRGLSDFWIIKLDSLGNKQWDKTIGGTGNELMGALIETKDGSYVLGGESTSGISYEKTENTHGSGDFWVVKLNKRGNKIWDKTIGGADSETLTDIKEIKKDVYALAGYASTGISGDKTDTSRGWSDFWIVKLKDNSTTTAISTNTAQAITTQKFYVYPNPAKNILFITNTGAATITLTTSAGKKIFTKQVTGNTQINITGYTAGLYFLKKLQTNEVQKIIITE